MKDGTYWAIEHMVRLGYSLGFICRSLNCSIRKAEKVFNILRRERDDT